MLEVNGKTLCMNCFAEITKEPCHICGFGISESDTNMDPSILPAGTILSGKYAIGKLLGRGGFGITYLGYHLTGDKKIAMKEYFPDSLAYRTSQSTLVFSYTSSNKDVLYKDGAEKFYEEAKTLSRFNGHPNIINVYEFFYENNTAYFVMEYVEGIDFKAYVKQNGGRLSYQKAIKLITPILDALSIIHSTGILHRDISPDNIYITNDEDVKLLDFGAARQVFGEQSKSLSVILKQGFAPFEQYQKRGKQGPWTDIYALGATIYYLICGKVPEEVMERLDHDELERPSEMGIEIHYEIEQVLLKMLAIRMEDRYQNVIAVKHDLNLILNEEHTHLNHKLAKVTTQRNEHCVLDKQHDFQNVQPKEDSIILVEQPPINRNKKKKILKASALRLLFISMVAVIIVMVVVVYREAPLHKSRTMFCSVDTKYGSGYQLREEINMKYIGDIVSESIQRNLFTAETDLGFSFCLSYFELSRSDEEDKAKYMQGVTYEASKDSSSRQITEHITLDFNTISSDDYDFMMHGIGDKMLGNKGTVSLAKAEQFYIDQGYTCNK